MAKIIGGAAYVQRLRGATTPAAKVEIDKALLEGGFEVAKTAKRLIIEGGSSSGGVHVPSRPGSPPNSDTGYLAANIRAEPQGSGIVYITSYANYSAHLEFGGIYLASRPFMLPALTLSKTKIVALVRAARFRAISRYRGGPSPD